MITGLFFFRFPIRSNEVVIASQNQVLTDTLPDASVVTLNKNSSLAFPKTFNQKGRNVQLKGEAFFHVAANTEKPFIIKTGSVSIKVVGTSFNVKQMKQRTEIIVETGVVRVTKNTHTVRLLPHQKAIVFRDKDKPVVEQTRDKLYNYYRTKAFVCDGTPLWRLVDALNEAYGSNIIIANDRIRNLPLTTTFKNRSLSDILTILTQTLNIQASQNNGQIILN